MSVQIIENNREGAEVYKGAEVCKQKSKELLKEINMPSGLLPLDQMEEVGFNRVTRFVWLTQKKPGQHRFDKIGKLVSYDRHVTAYVEDRRMKKVHGVKAKELLFWITLNDISIEDPDSGKITFGTPTGISRVYPVDAFVEEEEEGGKVGNSGN